MFPTTPLEQLIQELPCLLLRIDEIHFSVRTQKCLLANNINHIGELIQLTEQGLLHLPSFGKKSLQEIVSTLNIMSLQLNTKINCWPPEDIQLLQKQHSEKLAKQKTKLYLHNHQASASCLEEELYNIANQSGERNAQIFTQRMGWDGRGGKTLDEVGKKYGMTRERVRQICSKIEKIIKLNNPPANFTKQAIDYTNENTPNAASVIEDGLIESKISQHHFRIEGLITAASILEFHAPFSIETVGRKRTRLAIHYSLIGAPKIIKQEARKHIAHWGAGTILDIICRIETEHKVTVSEPLMILVLESIEGFRWLDQNSGWFWLSNNKRNRIINLIKQISSVANRLSLDELRSGIMRPYRMKGYSPPKRVLKAICEQSSEFKVDGSFVIADPPLKWEEALEGTNAYDLVMALKVFGPILTRSDFEILCLNKGMNQTSFYMYLGASPLIQRYSRGVYGLRGANVPSTAIEQLRKKVEKETQIRARTFAQNKVLLDFGRTNEGTIWIAYKLSNNSVSSGVVTTPGPMQKYLTGEFSLYSADEIHMGSLKSNQGSTWGLSPYFRRRGAEPGDSMLLLYNINSKKVSVKLGDEDIFDRFVSK